MERLSLDNKLLKPMKEKLEKINWYSNKKCNIDW